MCVLIVMFYCGGVNSVNCVVGCVGVCVNSLDERLVGFGVCVCCVCCVRVWCGDVVCVCEVCVGGGDVCDVCCGVDLCDVWCDVWMCVGGGDVW